MFGLDLDAWNTVMVSFLGVAAIAAVVVGVSTAIIIKLQKQAELESNERIASLKTQGDQLRKDTAEANARAAEAALELAKFRTPRFRLLQEGSNAEILTKALLPVAGTKFDIGHQNVGREQWDFLWVLEPIFAKSGWLFVDWIGRQTFNKLNWTMEPHTYGLANVLNVSIELNPETRGQLLPAAEALAAGLSVIGIAAQVEDHPISGTSDNAEAIHILVGNKE